MSDSEIVTVSFGLIVPETVSIEREDEIVSREELDADAVTSVTDSDWDSVRGGVSPVTEGVQVSEEESDKL